MKLAIHYPDFSTPGGAGAIAGTLADTAQAAEAAGVAQFTVMDHYFQMEAFTPAHRADARGLHNAGLPRGKDRADDARPAGHRRDLPPPRAAGQDRDHPRRAVAEAGRSSASAPPGTSGSTSASACPSRRTTERFERLEETLQICQQMWSDNDGPFKGKHYQLAETICAPQPIQQPGPTHPHRRQRGEEDAAAGGAVRRRAATCSTRAPTRCATSSTCCRATATTSGRDYAEIQKTII